VPLKNPLIGGFNGFAFYLLLPLAILLFAWKAAVFPKWGSGLLCVAIGIIASHAMLADSDGSRPAFRDDLAHHSDLISLSVPR